MNAESITAGAGNPLVASRHGGRQYGRSGSGDQTSIGGDGAGQAAGGNEDNPRDAPGKYMHWVTDPLTPGSGSADGTINGETIKRQIWQIPNELIPRILAIAGPPEPRAVGIQIEPPHLDPVSTIIGKPLDPHARHWLGKAVT